MAFNILTEEVRIRYKHSWLEDDRLEFKSAKGGIPAELWSSYSAFANTAGGIILLGVEDDGSITGVKNPQKTIDTLFITQNNPQKCSEALCDNRHIQVIGLAGKKVVAMYVPKAEPGGRPVFLRGNEANSYIRRGSADVRCKKEDITRMHRNRVVVESPVFSLDATIIRNSNLQDLDAATLRKFRQRMQITSLGESLQDLDDAALLTKLGGYRVDRDSGEEGITMAGLLMFGSSDSLQELLPHFQLDFFEYDDSTDILKRWVDRITTDGTWPGNLYEFFYKVLPRLNQALKVPFKLNADLARDESSPAQVAIREALANALIHADYFEHFGVRIDLRPSGITLTNPGSLLVDTELLFSDQQHPSICRNKNLQKMFQALGIGDKAGSGIDKIVNGWMDYCIALPQVQELQQPDRVVWDLPFTSMIPKKRIDEVSAAIGLSAYSALDRWDKLILLCIPLQRAIGHSDLAGVLRLHPADLSKRLARLVNLGLLEPSGRGRGTKYHLPTALSATTNGQMSDLNASNVRPLGQMSDLNTSNGRPLDQMADLNAPNGRPLDQMADLDGNADSAPPFPEIVRKVAKDRKSTQQEMWDAILTLCGDTWRTSADIASILDRGVRTIRRHCDALVFSRKLTPKHPESPHHPMQAYCAVPAPDSPKTPPA